VDIFRSFSLLRLDWSHEAGDSEVGKRAKSANQFINKNQRGI